MKLYENKETFYGLIETVSAETGISTAQIEKDYFITVLLHELVKNVPNLLFKGGTSLSKCHKIINRFSEDIDLTLDKNHFTQGNRRKVKYALLEACDNLGFEVLNADQSRSRRDYNSYDIQYPIKYYANDVKPTIKAETVYIQKSYPDEIMTATSIIYDYLKEQGSDDFISSYSELLPFSIRVQTLERTLVDKVFAVCDYKISNNVQRNSRHLYDLFCLLERVKLDDALKELVKEVREDRKQNIRCYSAQDNVDVPNILEEIIESKIYETDYETITRAMMFKNRYIPYYEIIKSLDKIIESGVFATDEEMCCSKKKDLEM